MGNLLYAIAVTFVIIWSVGYLGYGGGTIVYVLLAIAVVAIMLRLLQGKKIF